jgi:hypothetical protein
MTKQEQHDFIITEYNKTEALARFLHDSYEEIAKAKGWNTQDSCKKEFKDLPIKNRETMISLAGKLRNSDWCKAHITEEELNKIIENILCSNKDGGLFYIQKGSREIQEKLVKLYRRAWAF